MKTKKPTNTPRDGKIALVDGTTIDAKLFETGVAGIVLHYRADWVSGGRNIDMPPLPSRLVCDPEFGWVLLHEASGRSFLQLLTRQRSRTAPARPSLALARRAIAPILALLPENAGALAPEDFGEIPGLIATCLAITRWWNLKGAAGDPPTTAEALAEATQKKNQKDS